MVLLVEAAVFGSAALMHAGILMRGYEHRAARTAESVIALALRVGVIGSVARPASSRAIGLGVQLFALVGTAVGIAPENGTVRRRTTIIATHR
jgi:hypothetical protein